MSIMAKLPTASHQSLTMIRRNHLNHWRSQTFRFVILATVIQQSFSQVGYNVGGIFSSVALQSVFKDAVDVANIYPETHGLGNVRLNYSMALTQSDPIQTMREICNKLINSTVHVVITDRLLNTTRPPYIVSYACAFYNIPVIGVASRESQFSDKVSRFRISTFMHL